MFSLLRLAFTLLICVVVVGIFLGWFSFHQSPPDPQTNKVNINVSVDKRKIGSDLQKIEQKVHSGIQDLNNPPPTNPVGANPPPGQQSAMPRLSFGPISVQPTWQPGGQPPPQQSGIPGLSLGPVSLQPSWQNGGQPAPAPNMQPIGPPQYPQQAPDYQYTAPLALPPGGGR